MKVAGIGCVALLAATLAACANQQQASGSPRSPNQLKQQELQQMEAQGQRNDIDKPLAK